MSLHTLARIAANQRNLYVLWSKGRRHTEYLTFYSKSSGKIELTYFPTMQKFSCFGSSESRGSLEEAMRVLDLKRSPKTAANI